MPPKISVPGSAAAWRVVLLAALLAGCGKKEDPTASPAPSASVHAFAPDKTPFGGSRKGLPAIPESKQNPASPDKIALGRQLYFDKRLSEDGTRACETCHGPGKPPAPLDRDPPPLFNVGYKKQLFWDGRESVLEKAVRSEWEARLGTAGKKLAARARRVADVPGYRAQIDAVFGKDTAAVDGIVQALAAFLRSLTCGDSAFDRFRAGDQNALEPQQKKGWELFSGKAGCTTCHGPPFFSDAFEAGGFHNTGIGTREAQKEGVDPGRGAVTEADTDFAAFRTPSLRNVEHTGPYFHDGSVESLDAAVISMARGGRANPGLSERLKDRKLEPHELQAVIDFLPALSCRFELPRPPLPPEPNRSPVTGPAR